MTIDDPESKASASLSTDVVGVSVASSGPWGAHFEGQVGAFYMLAMLCGAPPRGLPGTVATRVALQQANAGRPLDDVVVHAVDAAGKPAVLEIQVKRTISFSPTDEVFRKVVSQIARAMLRPDFWSTKYELAIATARSSFKIDGAYQDVLAMARQIGDAASFMSQIRLPGAANEDMRAFVSTFQGHLRDEGAAHDDETTWKLLQRLHILTFDFAVPGSASQDLARERARATLHEDEASRADAFWGNLVDIALTAAKSGGDKTRETLLESLAPLGFRFSANRRHASARAVLAEGARQALADIDNRVGKARLSRHERVAEVHDALDRGRYVEIRGDSGVGKSGVLRQVAEALQADGQVLVLSPGRCVPRGWLSMRNQIGFDGSLRELLMELANDGGAVVFIDNLDSFNDEERHTVVDIVREAADVPAVSVLATARADFGVEEPSWLPDDALARLGQSPAVAIDDLSKAEIQQLTANDSALVPLLSEGHPARKVSRNLFRLARLAGRPSTSPLPRTEAEMATQWWSTADGERDAGWRDRSRLLNALALQAIAGHDSLDVSGHPAQSVDALVASGTLRSLSADRVSFRHDVLREWAIANATYVNPTQLNQLDLSRPAPAVQGRGVELTARMAIEQDGEGGAWKTLVERLGDRSVHRSWKRATLLALVRSEAAEVALRRAQPILFANQASLLRELISTVLAVEVTPASKVFAEAGVAPALIPAGIMFPKGAVWPALIGWLLEIGDDLPADAVPEAVDLYTTFSIGTLGLTAITPLTTRQIYRWLRSMEPEPPLFNRTNASSPWSQLENDRVQALRQALRTGFVLFSRTTPGLAAEYLQAILKGERDDRLAISILKTPGSLSQAAPAELAQLTAHSLIERPQSRARRGGAREHVEAFTYIDHEFLPASPAQGPFYELLVNSPRDGLALIHVVVGHAVTHASGGQDAGSDAIELATSDGVRRFPWTGTYFWSRGSNHYAVTSALMALEAWAHRRIESGEPFEAVISDVLGPSGSCAAYLLVAVDLICSHWPNSAGCAVDFVGCPELLCLDHGRSVHDQAGMPDFFGMGASRPEPHGAASSADLKKRPSRRMTLDELVGKYNFSEETAHRTKLTSLLDESMSRLGPFGPEDDLSKPTFMAAHARNMADPANWPEVEVELRDGSKIMAHRYVSPTAEQQHLQALRDKRAERSSDFGYQSVLTLSVDDPGRLSPENRLAAVTWARRPEPASVVGDDDDEASRRMRREAVLVAAMVTMRDGDESLRAEHGAWARAHLESALRADGDDPVHQVRSGLRFNPTAIAYSGLIHTLARENSPQLIRELLDAAANGRHAAAHGFGAAISTLESVDDRLPRSILRCALRACIVPFLEWDASDEKKSAREERRRSDASANVDAEVAWLTGSGPEPQWPAFPKRNVQRRRRRRLTALFDVTEQPSEVDQAPMELVVYDHPAALWLRQVQVLGNADRSPWLRDVSNTYMQWTVEANGGGSENDEEIERSPFEWNQAFFSVVARSVVGLLLPDALEQIVEPIASLPDQNFFDVLHEFLRSFDGVFFNGEVMPVSEAVAIRAAFADRMMKSSGWDRLRGTRRGSIEMHIGPAIATLFFNEHGPVGKTKCYLLEKGVERLGPFLPVLGGMVGSAPSPFVALVTLNLLGVSPRSEHLELLVQAGKAWLEVYPDFRIFWIDHGFGKRWCEIVEKIYTHDLSEVHGNAAIRAGIDFVVAELVGLGVAEASRLEELLRNR